MGAITGDTIGEIPRKIAKRVTLVFPAIFNKVLDAVREVTVYGKTCKIVD